MKTVLVTGSNGLLGQKITEKILNEGGLNLIASSKGKNRYPIKEGYVYADMDILDPIIVRDVVERYKPDSIIHTAALTNVDVCEDQKELAYELNVKSVETLMLLAEEYNIQLVHLSTDFIFDGVNGPYDELSAPNPLSYYGQTKLRAEELLKNSKAKWAILRTIIVYGVINDPSRSNIVLWAKGALEKFNPINVVNDQWRMPTLAEDLADICFLAIEHDAQGVYNASGKDMMSISELVARVADFWKLDKSLIHEISAVTLNQTAMRPKRTGFILDKSMTELNYQPHSFEEGLAILDSQMKSKVKSQ